MTTSTTIQVSRELAEKLRRQFPGLTYEDAIKRYVEGEGTLSSDRVLFFSMVVNPSTQKEVSKRVGLIGKINEVQFHFPAGTGSLVQVKLMIKRKKGDDESLIPSQENSFIFLEDVDYTSRNLSIPVNRDDTLRVEWWNYDSAFAHTVPVTVRISEAG